MSKIKKKPDPMDVYVGSRIRLQRNSKNMTQQQLSKQLGVTFQQIQKYEKGTNRVGASRLKAISEVLDTPISFFFTDTTNENNTSHFADGFAEEKTNSISSSSLAEEGAQLIEAFMKITDAQVRRKLIDLTTALSQTDLSNKDISTHE